MKTKLSKNQASFLERLLGLPMCSERCPFVGGRDAGRVAGAWLRTARSLQDRGFVVLNRSGDSWRADLSYNGGVWLHEHNKKD